MSPRNIHRKTSKYMTYLSVWIGFVSLMAFGNTIQCFLDHGFLHKRLYTASEMNVNGLVARLFGMWTLIAGALRLYCALDIYNKQIYSLTLFTFFAVLAHFVTEIIFYQTAELTVGVAAPILVSSISIVFMIQGYQYLDSSPATKENEEIVRKSKKKYG